MTQQTIVAHFKSRDAADEARQALIDEGVAEEAVRLYPEVAAEGYSRSTSSYDAARDEGGFWASLASLFLPDGDRYAYAEGMSRGGATLSVSGEAEHVETLSTILERHGAVDMDDQESEWRSDGWTGYASGATGGHTAAATGASMSSSSSAGEIGASDALKADKTSRSAIDAGPGAEPASGVANAVEGHDDEVIPIVEEQLRVGKREAGGGRVRVRSYVVETPIEEQVNLRREHVDVSRRPVDRAVTASDDAFQERTIEAEEHDEEAVVSKEARIKEELVIRKDVETQTQTIHDTVRRTEVEVDDSRTDAGSTERR